MHQKLVKTGVKTAFNIWRLIRNFYYPWKPFFSYCHLIGEAYSNQFNLISLFIWNIFNMKPKKRLKRKKRPKREQVATLHENLRIKACIYPRTWHNVYWGRRIRTCNTRGRSRQWKASGLQTCLLATSALSPTFFQLSTKRSGNYSNTLLGLTMKRETNFFLGFVIQCIVKTGTQEPLFRRQFEIGGYRNDSTEGRICFRHLKISNRNFHWNKKTYEQSKNLLSVSSLDETTWIGQQFIIWYVRSSFERIFLEKVDFDFGTSVSGFERHTFGILG